MSTTMRKLRMGMVGGGDGAFIGAVHRHAALMDGHIELVCGAFSRDAEHCAQSGAKLGLPHARCYPNFEQMFATESKFDADDRMDFVSIVTPNHLHFPVAKAALEHGFHVICDKPATASLDEALALKSAVAQSQRLYALTHTYTGYPMVKEARTRVASGELGKVRKVVVEYSQGWLATPGIENNKQAAWRLDPERAGASCCIGDIGTHAANLAEYICADTISEICSLLDSSSPKRKLDDDGTVMLAFESGARGVLLASQICVGEENNLRIRVYGDKASLDWQQQEPNTLWLRPVDSATLMLRAGVGELAPITQAAMRVPAGHPEGYLEAFANIYSSFAAQVRHHDQGISMPKGIEAAPGIDEGIRGMAFIETAVAASKSNEKWHRISRH